MVRRYDETAYSRDSDQQIGYATNTKLLCAVTSASCLKLIS